jgi:ABC-2 type transport system permease protein
MRWLRLARDDVAEARRDRSLYAIGLMFAILGALAGWVLGEITKSGAPSPLGFSLVALQLFAVLVPVEAVMASYDSIVDRRSLGSLHLLLGLPYLRRDVFLGSYAGRVVLSLVATVVAVAAMAVVGALLGGADALTDPVSIGLVVALTATLAVVFTGIGLAFSMVTRSSNLAGIGSFLVLVLLVFLWGVFVNLLVFLATRLGVETSMDAAWVTFVHSLNPHNAFKALASTRFAGFEEIGALLTAGGAFYQTALFAALVLSGWAVVVPGLAYLRFRGADL